MSALPSEASLFPLVVSRLFPSPRGPASPGGIWIQGVSVGEVEVALTLANLLASLRPGLPLLLTSTTPAGVGLFSRRRPGAWRPFPLDVPSSVRRFFDATEPRLLVLVETELWPAVLAEARRRAIPVLVVNARLSCGVRETVSADRANLRQLPGTPSRPSWRAGEDAFRFPGSASPLRASPSAGDLKFDRAPAPEPPFAERLRRLANGRPILVAGSVAESEIPLVLEVRRRLREGRVSRVSRSRAPAAGGFRQGGAPRRSRGAGRRPALVPR